MAEFSPNPKSDLFTLSSGAFSVEDQAKIQVEAEARWKTKVEAGIEKETAWREVVVDFHRTRYWGHKLLSKQDLATKSRPTEEQIRNSTVRRFFWTALQSLVLMKGVIMYFGLNYAIEVKDRAESYGSGNDFSPERFYGWGLAVSVLVSFGGLIWFAIKQSRSKHWD